MKQNVQDEVSLYRLNLISRSHIVHIIYFPLQQFHCIPTQTSGERSRLRNKGAKLSFYINMQISNITSQNLIIFAQYLFNSNRCIINTAKNIFSLLQKITVVMIYCNCMKSPYKRTIFHLTGLLHWLNNSIPFSENRLQLIYLLHVLDIVISPKLLMCQTHKNKQNNVGC